MWPNFINVFTLSIACILVFILSIIPAKTKTRNSYLILLLLALIVHLIAEQLYLIEIINIYIYSVLAVGMVILLGPALYYYTRIFYGLSTRYFLRHIIPLELGMLLIYYFRELPQWVFSFYYASILMFYFMAVTMLKPEIDLDKSQAWMKTLGIGFGILVLLHFFEVIWINIDLPSAIHTIRFCTALQNVFTSVFLLIVVRQIITNPESFSNLKIRIPNEVISSNKYKTELDIIASFVIINKAYKNSEISRQLISEETGLSINQISEVINSECKKNFSTWINDYRINEAKVLLKESHLNIREIYCEVGFNSKSAFNTAFKKRTKVTPTMFRNII